MKFACHLSAVAWCGFRYVTLPLRLIVALHFPFTPLSESRDP